MAVLQEAKWTADSRKAHKAAGGYFAGPDDTFPLKDASDVSDAWDLAGHADDPDQVRANIKRWAKDNGHADALPDTAKDDNQKQESASVARPAKKIATLKVCFLEDGARSLNGRIYPKSTCAKILQSGLAKLSNPNALPMTVFVSHETANSNVNTELVGHVAKLWQEGSKYFANLDLADTRVAHDMLALTVNGALKSESMRVLGVELLHDRNYDLPLVVPQEGVQPELLGIDLTTRPGLIDSARIMQTLYESHQGLLYESHVQPDHNLYIETFSLVDAVHIESKELLPAMKIPLYLKLILGEMAEGITPDRAAHQRIHDHLAGVLDATVKAVHGSESARLRASVESELSEEGRALAMKHAKPLAAAHDESARQLGMECEGAYNQALNIPGDSDNDGDNPDAGLDPDNDGESQKGNKLLTEEEMLAALKAKGYQVEAPKSAEQQLQEAFDAKLAEQERKFNEKLAALTGTQSPQRQTFALGSGLEEGNLKPEEFYEEGDYLKGDLAPKNWRALSDRRVPWPKDIDPKQALQEMAPFLAFRLNMEEAHARGRDISQFIEAHEQV